MLDAFPKSHLLLKHFFIFPISFITYEAFPVGGGRGGTIRLVTNYLNNNNNNFPSYSRPPLIDDTGAVPGIP